MRRISACILVLLLCLSTPALGAETAVLTAGHVEPAEGETSVILDVALEGGAGAYGGSFFLWYDSLCLELTALEAGPALEGAVTALNPRLGDGVAKVSWISLEPLAGEGVVARATFTLLAEEASRVELLNAQLLDQEGNALPLQVVSGAVSPPEQPEPGSPSGGTSSGGQGGSVTGPAQPEAAEENPFQDVETDAWYYEAVIWAQGSGVFQGTAADRFSPEVEMDRAMLATVLWRAEGSPEDGGDLSQFSDESRVPDWAERALAWAVGKGILQGDGDRLLPQAPLTREALATMLLRYRGASAGEAAALSAFVDQDAVSSWALGAMAWAVETDTLRGKDGSRLDPGGTATRAEVAAVLYRLLDGIS